ncbi:MAG: complex I NDUFA9 subunit family protein, partial [Pseudomonadota bacterium]
MTARQSSKGLVTIFGGSGFIGRYAARRLVEDGYRVRIAVRRTNVANSVRLAGPPGWVDVFQANVRNRASVDAALDGASAVVNLVGILFERGKQSFEAAQLEGAKNVAEACRDAGIKRLVHMSAIGADPESKSHYGRTKGEAEKQVRELVPDAVILRPSIVFGPEDDFFNRFASLASHPMSGVLPFLPAIGGGHTKLQPVYAGDVADAIAEAVGQSDAAGKTFELGGPTIYSFREL